MSLLPIDKAIELIVWLYSFFDVFCEGKHKCKNQLKMKNTKKFKNNLPLHCSIGFSRDCYPANFIVSNIKYSMLPIGALSPFAMLNFLYHSVTFWNDSMLLTSYTRTTILAPFILNKNCILLPTFIIQKSSEFYTHI